MRVLLMAAAVACATAGPAIAQGGYPLAGLAPDRRPEGAPVLREIARDRQWQEKFHFGVSRPFPPGLGAADQGAWYSPFGRPGMTGPYDLRDWHRNKGKSQ